MVVNLKCPIVKGERKLTSLILPDKVLVRHIMAGDSYSVGTVEREVAILSAMTGESELILREMEAKDWIVVQAKVKALIEGQLDDDGDTEEKDKKGDSPLSPTASMREGKES